MYTEKFRTSLSSCALCDRLTQLIYGRQKTRFSWPGCIEGTLDLAKIALIAPGTSHACKKVVSLLKRSAWTLTCHARVLHQFLSTLIRKVSSLCSVSKEQVTPWKLTRMFNMVHHSIFNHLFLFTTYSHHEAIMSDHVQIKRVNWTGTLLVILWPDIWKMMWVLKVHV